MPFDNSDTWYDDQGRPHITVTPPNPLPIDQSYDPATGVNYPTSPSPYTSGLPVAKNSLIDTLTGAGGGERYQLFPERIVRSALSLPTDVLQGTVTSQINPGRMQSSDVLPEDELLQRVQDMAALMGGGGLLNTTERAGLQELPSITNRVANMLKSDSEAAAPVAALENAPIFHSAVENAVNTSSLKSASADQWLGTISNAKGVKPEELDWTGLKDYLKEQDGVVSKEQVQQYLQDNKVQLGEVNKGKVPQIDKSYSSDDFNVNETEHQYILQTPEGEELKVGKGTVSTPEEAKDYAARYFNDRLKTTNQLRAQSDPTKYSKYQLPGGENYREKLLTLPNTKLNDFANENNLNLASDAFKRQGYINANGEEPPVDYKSSHWDEPNILAHIRMNDRFFPDEAGPSIKDNGEYNKNNLSPETYKQIFGEPVKGYKALHIEEIQSDWHQQGREKGYKLSPEDSAKLEPEFNRIDDKIVNSGDEEVMGHPDINQAVKMATERKIITPQEAKTYLRYSDSQRLGAVPDAPFKKTWLDLALKRVIREAAEKGYDRVSWTPGEAQTSNPKVLGQTGVDADKADVGLRHWYNERVPQALEKLTGEKTKQSSINTPAKVSKFNIRPSTDNNGKTNFWVYGSDNVPTEPFSSKAAAQKWINENAKEKQQNVSYINLPQQVKDTALHKGFPLFSSGVMLTPTNNDPFQHKLTPVDKIPGLTPMSHDPFSVGNDSDPQVNNHDDVPYLAGASNTPSGYPVNIDRRMPRYDPKVLDKTGKPADLWKYLKVHEIEEHKAMLGGTPYAKAHSTIATPAERAAVEADGVSWSEYQHVMDGYLDEIEHEHPASPPKNLYLKPYPHNKEVLLKHEEDNE